MECDRRAVMVGWGPSDLFSEDGDGAEGFGRTVLSGKEEGKT